MQRAVLLVVLFGAVACDQASAVSEQAKAAAASGTEEVGAQSKTALEGMAKKAGQMKTDLFADLQPGKLSATAKRLIAAAPGDSASGLSTIISKGEQIVPAATAIGTVLDAAVDDETAVEPIYQKIEDEAAVDAALGNVPHVEIDGVHVGIRRLDDLEGAKQTKERVYLLAWRREDHLVGFIYRTRRTVDYETLVREAPALVRLTQKTAEGLL